jgi:hypothetical protein
MKKAYSLTALQVLIIINMFSRKGAKFVRLNIFFSRKGAKNAKNFNVYFVLTTNIFACLAPWRDYICFFSRRGAKNAKNFNVYSVLTPDTFACFAPWRDYICFFLSQRRQDREDKKIYILSLLSR